MTRLYRGFDPPTNGMESLSRKKRVADSPDLPGLAVRAIAPVARVAGFAPLSLTFAFVGAFAKCRFFASLRMTGLKTARS